MTTPSIKESTLKPHNKNPCGKFGASSREQHNRAFVCCYAKRA